MRSASRLWAAWRRKKPPTSAGMAVEVEQLDSAAAPRVPGLEKNLFKIIQDTTIYVYTYVYI